MRIQFLKCNLTTNQIKILSSRTTRPSVAETIKIANQTVPVAHLPTVKKNKNRISPIRARDHKPLKIKGIKTITETIEAVETNKHTNASPRLLSQNPLQRLASRVNQNNGSMMRSSKSKHVSISPKRITTTTLVRIPISTFTKKC